MTKFVSQCCALALFAAAGACGSRPNGALGGNDGGRANDSSSPCNQGAGNLCDATASCTINANGACAVMPTSSDAGAPQFTGGTIVDGTYYLTAVTVYGADTIDAGNPKRVTMTFSEGSNYTLIQDSDALCSEPPTASGTYVISGSQLTLATACPVVGTSQSLYTATATSLTLSTSRSSTDMTVLGFIRQ